MNPVEDFQLIQHTEFPQSEQSTLIISVEQPKRFAIDIRKPNWIKEKGFEIKVNGKLAVQNTIDGYVKINRVWKKGDRITINLPMENHVEYLPDHSGWVSFLHGPLVLAAPTDITALVGLHADDSRWGHIATGPLLALAEAPLLASNDHDLANELQPIENKSMSYGISNLIVQPDFKNLKLIPFYQGHDARYMVYWPVTSVDSIQQKQRELQVLDDRYFKLASRTIDQVFPGEQQPENDHVFTSVKAECGIFRNVHWRSAAGYFSYRMRMNAAVKTLGVTYYGKESNREFDIFINDAKITHVLLNGTGNDDFVNAEYKIPAELITVDKDIVIKFVATNGYKTASIYDVRLLR